MAEIIRPACNAVQFARTFEHVYNYRMRGLAKFRVNKTKKVDQKKYIIYSVSRAILWAVKNLKCPQMSREFFHFMTF